MPSWLVRTPRPMASVLASTQTQSPPSTVPGASMRPRIGMPMPRVGGLVQRRLGPAQRLAHRQDDRAMIGHQRRIMGEDGIGEPVIGIGQPFDLGAGGCDQVGRTPHAARAALRRIEARAVVPLRRLGAAHGACRPSASARASAAPPWIAHRTVSAAEHPSSRSPEALLLAVNRHAHPAACKGQQCRVDGGKRDGSILQQGHGCCDG